MAVCRECGKQMGFLEGHAGLCSKCRMETNILTGEPMSETKKKKEEEEAAIEAIMLTTETAPNLPIVRRIEVITAECAYGMHIFRDLFAGVRDIVGGRSEAVQKTMRDARRTTLYELKREAYRIGANAVVGVDLDYVELSSAGSMVMLVASGTAVVVETEISKSEA